MKHSSIGIVAVGSYIPTRRVSNDELSRIVDTTDQWIREHTGIEARHIASDQMATSDMAVLATENLLQAYQIDRSAIGAIIVATATQDFLGFPSTACVVQHKMGLNNIPAFDLAAGCTGFIYAVEVAKGLLLANSVNSVLVIGSEKLSAIANWDDRNTCVLFGDGAGAVLVAKAENSSSLIDSVLHAEGNGFSHLMVPKGGTSAPYEQEDELSVLKLQMNGRAVYNFAVRAITDVIENLLMRNGITIDEVDWIVPHQANSRIIKSAAKRLGIEEKKFYMNIAEYANTSAASIPIALAEMEQKKVLLKGMLVLTVGFGAGLTYGGNLIRW
ncbi:MAG: beta-ketoacyl-ACP synthase III [Sphaerochaetaceae bacterium]